MLGALFQILGPAAQRKNMSPPELAKLLPEEISGWAVENRPVADSPEMLKTVERVLDYDSAIFRIYKQGGVEISVYAAYWLPAKVPVTQVDAHTPDICWVANGWKMSKRQPLASQAVDGLSVPVPNVRDFQVSGQALSVIYWHINGSELRQGDSVWEATLSAAARVKRRIAQFKNIIFSPPDQQLFVRVSSNHDIADQLDSAPVKACLALVADALRGEVLYKMNK